MTEPCPGTWGYPRPFDGGTAQPCSGCDTWLLIVDGRAHYSNGATLEAALQDHLEAKRILQEVR